MKLEKVHFPSVTRKMHFKTQNKHSVLKIVKKWMKNKKIWNFSCVGDWISSIAAGLQFIKEKTIMQIIVIDSSQNIFSFYNSLIFISHQMQKLSFLYNSQCLIKSIQIFHITTNSFIISLSLSLCAWNNFIFCWEKSIKPHSDHFKLLIRINFNNLFTLILNKLFKPCPFLLPATS